MGESALKHGYAGEHYQNHLTRPERRIRPYLNQRVQPGLSLVQLLRNFEQIFRRACESIKPCDALAPEGARGFPPPFLGALPEPGVVQVWSGLLARTLPEWSLLLRVPANIPKQGHYDLYEGIVETDQWFGSLLTNVRLTKTDVPVRFDANMPLL